MEFVRYETLASEVKKVIIGDVILLYGGDKTESWETIKAVQRMQDYTGWLPEGFEIIDLKPYKVMVFQGQPYDDMKFQDAISDLWEVMKTCNPEIYGFEWADEDGPRFQLAPMGYRGYIEARPVREIKRKAKN